MASAMTYFDALKLNTGHAYSLPPPIVSRCDYMRPYHFWMASYLSYQLKKSGYSVNASFNGGADFQRGHFCRLAEPIGATVADFNGAT
jgi:hypothetical protein